MKSTKEPQKVLAFFVALLFLSSCSKSVDQGFFRNRHFAQAKHFDIPIPIGYKQTYSASTPTASTITDEVHLEGSGKENPTQHFVQNLEAFSWKLEVLQGKATSVIARKQTKIVHMLIWLDGQTWHVHFFVSSDNN